MEVLGKEPGLLVVLLGMIRLILLFQERFVANHLSLNVGLQSLDDVLPKDCELPDDKYVNLEHLRKVEMGVSYA